MNRIKRKASGSYHLEAAAYDDLGDAATISGSPTITIYDSADVQVATGTPTIQTGALLYDLAVSAVPKLDGYRCVWTGTVSGTAQSWETFFELCGGHLFEVADLRQFDAALDNATKFTAAKIRDGRVRAEERFEASAHRAFVPRGRRVVLSGDGTPDLLIPDADLRVIHSVSIDGVALTVGELAELVPDGTSIYRRACWPIGVRNIAVHYEFGLDSPPDPVRGAAMILAREILVPSSIPARALGEQTDVGFLRFTVAGKDAPIGIPEVDVVAQQFGRRRFVVG